MGLKICGVGSSGAPTALGESGPSAASTDGGEFVLRTQRSSSCSTNKTMRGNKRLAVRAADVRLRGSRLRAMIGPPVGLSCGVVSNDSIASPVQFPQGGRILTRGREDSQEENGELWKNTAKLRARLTARTSFLQARDWKG